jgi:hypothetical protein
MRSISAIEPKTSTLKERIATAIQAKTSIFTSDVTPILPYTLVYQFALDNVIISVLLFFQLLDFLIGFFF